MRSIYSVYLVLTIYKLLLQEKIVSSLSLKSSSGELECYCQMWSLRPFIDDQIMQQALSEIGFRGF